MDLQKLNYICTIAKHRSMAKAAKVLYITQPSLSKAIASIEAELGVQLFVRGPLGTELTEYGKAFLPYAETIIDHYESSLRAISEISGTHSNEVNLLFPIPELVMKILDHFPQYQPGIDINQSFSSLDSINKSLINGELDLYVGQKIEAGGMIIKTPLYREELFLIAPPGVPYENFQTVSLTDFEDKLFILPRKGEEMRDTLDSFFERTGFFPSKNIEVQDDRAMRVLVEAGRGVSFISSVSRMNIEQNHIHSGDSLPDFLCTLRVNGCSRDVNVYWTKRAMKQKGVMLFYNFMLGFIKEEIEKINETFSYWNVKCLLT